MTRGVYAQQQKRNLINNILNAIMKVTERGLAVNEQKLYGEVMLKYGIAKRKFIEHIESLIDAGHIRRTDKGLVYIKSEEEDILDEILDEAKNNKPIK